MITQIRLSISNAYLIRGEQNFLVDTGSAADFPKLEKALAREKLQFNDLVAIIHTHGHSDHAGCSARLQEEDKIPLVLHQADAPLVASGRNGKLTPTGFLGRVAKPFVDRPFPSFQPDIILKDMSELKALQFPGYGLHTPGHSEGSISLILDSGAIVGDIVRGGLLGGAAYHFFIEDFQTIMQSISKIIQTDAQMIYPGHLQPISLAALQHLIR